MDFSGYIRVFAKNEATGRAIYVRLARLETDEKRRALFLKLAEHDLKHYRLWLSIIGVREVGFSRMKVARYLLFRWLFGVTFAVKLMERREHQALMQYKEALSKGVVPGDKKAEIEEIINDELSDEEDLIGLIEDERVKYLGSTMLGLNDALVELTGALAGFASAISKTLLIGFGGLVVGIAAALSMAASHYLSVEVSEHTVIDPAKAAVYTGVSYILTILLLVAPFFVLSEIFIALTISLAFNISLVVIISYYSSVVLGLSFKRRTLKMLVFGLGIAAATYLIGRALNTYLGIEA